MNFSFQHGLPTECVKTQPPVTTYFAGPGGRGTDESAAVPPAGKTGRGCYRSGNAAPQAAPLPEGSPRAGHLGFAESGGHKVPAPRVLRAFPAKCRTAARGSLHSSESGSASPAHRSRRPLPPGRERLGLASAGASPERAAAAAGGRTVMAAAHLPASSLETKCSVLVLCHDGPHRICFMRTS